MSPTARSLIFVIQKNYIEREKEVKGGPLFGDFTDCEQGVHCEQNLTYRWDVQYVAESLEIFIT